MKVCIQEYLKAWRNKSIDISTFADHLINTGHSYEEGSETLLHIENKFFKHVLLKTLKLKYIRNVAISTILLSHIIPEHMVSSIIYMNIILY